MIAVIDPGICKLRSVAKALEAVGASRGALWGDKPRASVPCALDPAGCRFRPDPVGSSASGKIVRSYAWGLDVASSLTGTGGVGALVLETVHTDTTLTSYHVAYDGGGNVTALVNRKPGDASDGKVAAAYEYGPFGENVRAWVDPA